MRNVCHGQMQLQELLATVGSQFINDDVKQLYQGIVKLSLEALLEKARGIPEIEESKETETGYQLKPRRAKKWFWRLRSGTKIEETLTYWDAPTGEEVSYFWHFKKSEHVLFEETDFFRVSIKYGKENNPNISFQCRGLYVVWSHLRDTETILEYDAEKLVDDLFISGIYETRIIKGFKRMHEIINQYAKKD